jgi:hypothetical protein
MSQQDNIDDIFVDEEEGEIIEGNHHNSEEEGKEEEEEEDWGGAQNEVIIPQMEIVAALLGIAPVTIQREQSENTQNLRRSLIRPRDEVFTQPLPNKIYRNISGKRVIRNRTPFYSYLKLKSGEEFNFTEEDGKMLLLNEIIEPNRLIRNIISKVPYRLRERMEYL